MWKSLFLIFIVDPKVSNVQRVNAVYYLTFKTSRSVSKVLIMREGDTATPAGVT